MRESHHRTAAEIPRRAGHPLAEGTLPRDGLKTGATPWGGALELYSDGRYLTFTGHHAVGTTGRVEARQEQIDWLIETYFSENGASDQKTPADERKPAAPGSATADSVLKKIRNAKNAAKFNAFFDGGLNGQPSPSEAIQAMLWQLRLYTDDAVVLDEIVRRSKLHSGKWDEKRGDTTWGALEVQTAIRDYDGEMYDWAKRQPVAAATEGIVWGTLSEETLRPIRFLDKPFWQQAAFHLVVGVKNAGKGTFLAELAARITRGELGENNRVIWVSLSEDSYTIDVGPRMLVAGGNLELVTFLKKGTLRFPDDIAEIERKARELGNVGLIVLDPLGGAIKAGKSTNLDADVRDATAPLNDLADVLDCIVVGSRHITNKEVKNGALAGILGSSDWANIPRCVIAIAKDEEGVRHAQVVAGNRAELTAGKAFLIEGVIPPIPDWDGEPVTKLVWLGDSSRDVDQLLSKTSSESSKSGVARELILDILDQDGQQESDALDARVARETGLSALTVRNVRVDLKNEGLIKPHPDKDEFGEIIRWNVGRTLAERP